MNGLDRVRERALLSLLAGIQFVHIMDFMVVMPMGPQLMRLFSLNPEQFSMVVASYTLSAGVSGLIGAFLIDRFDRRHAILFTFIGFLLGTLACVFANGYMSLILARAVSGAFGGVSTTLVLTIIGDAVSPGRRGKAIGFVMMAFSVASVLGVPFGLWLSQKLSWHAPFSFIFGLGVLILGATWKQMPSMRGHLQKHALENSETENPSSSSNEPEWRRQWSRFASMVSDRGVQFALGFTFLMVFGHFIIIPFLSPILVNNIKLPETDLFVFYLAGGLTSMVSAPLIGAGVDRFGRKKMYILTILLGAIPVWWITHSEASSVWVVVALGALFFAFSGGRFIPGQTLATGAVAASLRGSFLSLSNSVRDFAAGMASYVGGKIVIQDALTQRLTQVSTLCWIGIGVSFLSVFLMLRVKEVA